jgi:hypothetical protein
MTRAPKAKPKAEVQTLRFPAPDDPSMAGTLKALGGSQNDVFNNILVNQVATALWVAHSDEDTRGQQFLAAVSALVGAKPTDELEGMLAAQMVAAHSAVMECYRRAMLKDQTFETRQENLRQAGKLSRVYAELMLALDKHRGKGQQRVTVEHVHVHQGGQAIVGNVQAGGGASNNEEGQPHAKTIAHAPGETLQSEIEAVREAVPIPGC